MMTNDPPCGQSYPQICMNVTLTATSQSPQLARKQHIQLRELEESLIKGLPMCGLGVENTKAIVRHSRASNSKGPASYHSQTLRGQRQKQSQNLETAVTFSRGKEPTYDNL